MRLHEIEQVPAQDFPKEIIEKYLERSTPIGNLEEFTINYLEHGSQRVLILTDIDSNVAAYAGFASRLNGRVWQAKNAQTYSPFNGRALVAKIYKVVKEQLHKSIQSDTEQSISAIKLWTKTLPNLGLKPMVFDTETERIISPDRFDLALMYPVSDSASKVRYTWILERHDHYPSQNLLTEDSLLLPVTGMWYNPNKGKL